jgi:hypothetical protein
MKKITALCLLSISILLSLTSTVHAYLDAGTGSMIMQLLLGGLAGLAVILKLFWGKIRGLFRIGKVKGDGLNETKT